MNVIKKLENIMQHSTKYITKDNNNHRYINKKILDKIIMKQCGIDQRTRKNYLEALKDFGYITSINQYSYRIMITPQNNIF